jgi:hypothetical protein
MKDDEMIDMIYRPPNQPSEPIAQNATLGVKFSTDIFLLKSFLDQQKIEYKIEDLENGPYGLFLRIKKDKIDYAP